MDEPVYRVGRREMWRVRLSGWRERLRRPNVWVLMLAGLAILIGTAWWYADYTAFARRAVPTGATIERIYPPIRSEHEYQPPDLVVHGMLRYQADGRTVHTQVWLATCSNGGCVAATRARQGHAVQIVYDPENVTRVHLGRRVPVPLNPVMLVLAGLGAIFIAAGLYVVFFDLDVPLAKPRGRRPAA
jgi:hypothetical protein